MSGADWTRETLDRFFAEALPWRRRRSIRAVCVDVWEPYRLSLAMQLPHARLVYDKFHILRHVSDAVDETRRAEFFRHGGDARRLIRGKRWLLLRRSDINALTRAPLPRVPPPLQASPPRMGFPPEPQARRTLPGTILRWLRRDCQPAHRRTRCEKHEVKPWTIEVARNPTG